MAKTTEKTVSNKTPPARLTKAAAARIVGVSARSISRYVERGDLEQGEDGKFAREELLEFQESNEEQEGRQDKSLALKEMSDFVQQSSGHLESVLKLMLQTQQAALKSVVDTNAQLVERVTQSESEKVAMWAIVGDVLQKKDERANQAAESAARRETLGKAGAVASQMIPTLMQQIAGKSVLKSFGDSLDAEQRVGIAQLADMFEGRQRADFEEILKGAGIGPDVQGEKGGDDAKED